mmetsp:Transcript_11326/g.16633  ORF Transcript_11326/g.16633 Transcript_11326/m.16633 type:complete len:215 (-) Transcript_11326:144-788(-)|eukprot:CAMPEP_0194219130 /NCGR_PEP_ID=MMETSP0156-20130528/25284_1 /TAXON_ID=33649 /ORGANISM="Thalassionema nitzschioides, Strain L26-B" /LENGTH=214 /DNA_ID=CAMNT_0038948695 /DNA_START=46 /DNA_END=690 /DNA_ORIENTATION=-
MSNIEERIHSVRSELLRIKEERCHAREKFIKDQATYADRQCLFLQAIGCLSQTDVSNLPFYYREVEGISSFDESSYVIAREAEVCQALHQVEVTTNQLRMLLKYHETTVEYLEGCLTRENQEGQDMLKVLNRKMDVVSSAMSTSIVVNQAKITQQKHDISILRGEYQIEDELQLLLSTSLNHRVKSKQTRRMSMEKAITRVSSLFGIYQTAEAA